METPYNKEHEKGREQLWHKGGAEIHNLPGRPPPVLEIWFWVLSTFFTKVF